MSNNVISFDFIDELKIEGIKFKGYGVLPKFVMIDTDLSVVAKGIYAYFCSYAGNGNTAFPSRDKIINDLKINKDTYYKHFNVITSQGYITVSQSHEHGGKGNGFSKNIYTLVSNPKKFENTPEQSYLNQTYMRIRFSGLDSAGYGFIPKAVMLDNRLPIEAKAIYAYFCVFTGNGNSSFPKVPVILNHLQISKPTYYKYFKLLLETNYITPIQRHIDGLLSVNDYYLNSNPNIETISKKTVMTISNQSTKFSDTQNIGEYNQSTKFSDTQKQDTQKQDTQISDTNNNNINNNNINNNQSFYQQKSETPYLVKMDKNERLNDVEYIKKIENELNKAGTLPYAFLTDDKKLTASIRILTEWGKRNEFYKKLKPEEKKPDSDLQQSAFNLFVEALIEMLTSSSQPMKIKGSLVTYSKVYDRIVPYIKQGNYTTSLYLDNVEYAAIEGFIKGCRDTEIKNPLQYMKACIWTALQIGEIGVLAQIKHDFG